MAQNEWILDVLADLKTFAASNGLKVLAEQLDDTKLVAAAEIALQSEDVRAGADVNRSEPGTDYSGFGRHQRA